MSNSQVRLVRFASLMVLALAAPITLSAKSGVSFNECGATEALTGTCCKHTGSVCDKTATPRDGYCGKASGSCNFQNPNPCTEPE